MLGRLANGREKRHAMVRTLQWQRRFFCPKGRFRIVVVSFSNRIVLCRFKRRFMEKTAFKRRFFLLANHKAMIKTPFIVSKGPVYRLFLDQSTTVSIKTFLTVNRLTNEQRCKNIVSLLDDVLHKCCASPKIFKVSFL